MTTLEIGQSALDLPVIKDRVRKRERIQGMRVGDWVIMPDESMRRLTSPLGETISHPLPGQPQPLGSVPDRTPGWVRYPSFSTSTIFEDGHIGSFFLMDNGSISPSGGNDFHNVSRRTKLVDTGQMKVGKFSAIQMGHPDIGHGVDFELPCRVYRVSED